MKPVFADTAFFLALINARDQHHERAAELNANLESPLLTTAWVLLELANALSASRSRARFEQVLARLRAEPNVEIVAPDADSFERGCQLKNLPAINIVRADVHRHHHVTFDVKDGSQVGFDLRCVNGAAIAG